MDDNPLATAMIPSTSAAALSLVQAERVSIRRLGVARLGIFGSFARDTVRPDSDLDVLVEFEAGQKTYDNLFELGALLETQFGRRVEVVTTDALSPYLGPKILREVKYVDLGN
jgi:predicted nucleotidyltransferase